MVVVVVVVVGYGLRHPLGISGVRFFYRPDALPVTNL